MITNDSLGSCFVGFCFHTPKKIEIDVFLGKRKPTASRKNTRKNKDTGVTSTPPKDFRKAVRREEITTKTTRADERPVAVSDEVVSIIVSAYH